MATLKSIQINPTQPNIHKKQETPEHIEWVTIQFLAPPSWRRISLQFWTLLVSTIVAKKKCSRVELYNGVIHIRLNTIIKVISIRIWHPRTSSSTELAPSCKTEYYPKCDPQSLQVIVGLLNRPILSIRVHITQSITKQHQWNYARIKQH